MLTGVVSESWFKTSYELRFFDIIKCYYILLSVSFLGDVAKFALLEDNNPDFEAIDKYRYSRMKKYIEGEIGMMLQVWRGRREGGGGERDR